MEWGSMLDLVSTLPQMVVTILIFRKCVELRKAWLYGIIYCLYCSFFYLMPANVGMNLTVKSIFIIFGPILFVIPFCRSPLIHFTICQVANYTLQLAVDIILSTAFYLAVGAGAANILENPKYYAVAKLFAFILYTLLMLLFLYIWKNKIKLKRAPPDSFVLLLGSQTVICMAMFDMGLQVYVTSTLIIIEATAICACVVGDILLLKYIRQLENQHQLAAEKQIMQVQLKAQLEHYDALLSGIEQVSRLRHDVNNQLQTVFALLENNEPQLAQTQAQSLQRQWREITIERFCSNRIVDAILVEKQKQCDDFGILLNAKMDIPAGTSIDGPDLCSVFCNILDNAINACKELPEENRRIEISAVQSTGYLTIVSSNPCKPEAPKVKKALSPLQRHGLGLEIIRSIAQKYEGRTSVENANETFTITVWLPTAL